MSDVWFVSLDRNKMVLTNTITKLERRINEMNDQMEEEHRLATEQKELVQHTVSHTHGHTLIHKVAQLTRTNIKELMIYTFKVKVIDTPYQCYVLSLNLYLQTIFDLWLTVTHRSHDYRDVNARQQ